MITPEQLAAWRQMIAALSTNRWHVQEATAAKFKAKAYEKTRWFVTAIPPDHPCWTDDMTSYTGLGVWTGEGVTSLPIATFIAAARQAVPALIEEVERLTAGILEIAASLTDTTKSDTRHALRELADRHAPKETP